MEQIPDAPWVREAERDGYPADPPVICPCCGEECLVVYMDRYKNVFACDRCIVEEESWEWAEEEREASKPDWADE